VTLVLATHFIAAICVQSNLRSLNLDAPFRGHLSED